MAECIGRNPNWYVENNSYLVVISDKIFFSNSLAIVDRFGLYESGNSAFLSGFIVIIIFDCLSNVGQYFSL